MTPTPPGDRWATLERLYHAALERPAAERQLFLDDACDGDATLRTEVESLLRFAGAAETFIEEPAAEMMAAAVADGVESGADLVGQDLGDYRVVSRLGSGGMGEVYRAHDSRLGRDVAIKVLPANVSRDPERLWRLRREARLLASLNHPNIGAIYGLEGAATAPALILELVEGPTLADIVARVANRGMKIDEAAAIARQIADALDAAHNKGVIHRDLKPANVKLAADGTVKVLDFGVATVMAGDRPGHGDEERLVAGSATRHGGVVGTPSYMSPEQARGEPVDKRADIWAFGCVLFEMLTGRPAFGGSTAIEIPTAVVENEPDWEALPASTPAGVRRLLARCLERSPKRRLRDIGDARLELDDLDSAPPVESRTGRNRALRWVLAGAGLMLALVSIVVWPRPEAAPERVQFSLDPPVGHVLTTTHMPSPDGSQILMLARSTSGETSLWIRAIESAAVQRIPGTEGAVQPFWSPDGRSVGFSADGMLKRTTLTGAAVQQITSVDPVASGATWSQDDVIVFAPSNRTPLYQVSAGGSGRAALTALNAERRENSHRWPHFLPDGRRFLFTARSDLPEHTGIYVASLDSPGNPKWLMAAQSSAVFVPSGHLLFVRDSTLFAQPFDVASAELDGEPAAVAGNVLQEPSAAQGMFAVSANGRVLSYSESGGNRLAWFDRSGKETPIASPRGEFTQVQLSPDGSRAALVMPDRQSGNRDIWLVTLADGGLTRLTSDPTNDWFPVWSPDGTEMIFASDRDGRPAFYRASTIGTRSEERVFLAASTGWIFPTDWSGDGRTLAFHSYPRGDVSLLPLSGHVAPTALVESPFTDWVAAFSPDRRWVAYVSDESGREQVYLKPVTASGKHRVSVNGGIQARWRADGAELFFLGPRNELMSVSVGRGPSVAGPPVQLFEGCRGSRRDTFNHLYDVAPDGRSLWICPGDGASAIATVNWASRAPRR
jgi:eukaryotic-like serine/threonine-protein kinase